MVNPSPVLNEPAPEKVLALERGVILYTSPMWKTALLLSEMTCMTPTIAGMCITLYLDFFIILCAQIKNVINMPICFK
jgi:hypothetical protein